MQLLEKTIAAIQPPDAAVEAAARERLRQQARPAGSLGILEDVGARLAGIFGTLNVHLKEKVVITCAGDHGICQEGVSLFPQEVTPQMIYNFLKGGASVNVLAKHAGARVMVADLGVAADFDPGLPLFHKKVGRGTANFAVGPAMSRQDAARSIEAGIEIVAELASQNALHLLGTGDMGIGNTTPSTAIISVFSGRSVAEVTGRGTGIDDAGLQRKIAAIEKGLAVNRPDPGDPLGVLEKVGGYEIGRIAGLINRAAAHRARGLRRFHLHRRCPDRLRPGTRRAGLSFWQPPVGGGRPRRHAGAPRPDAALRPQVPPGRRHRRRPGHGADRRGHAGAGRYQNL